MKELVTASAFKKDLRRCGRRGKDLKALRDIVEALQRGETLPVRCRDHALVGNWIPKRECHVTPDWLLVYETTETEVRLARLGSHADLF